MKKGIKTIAVIVILAVVSLFGYQGRVEAKTYELHKTYTFKGTIKKCKVTIYGSVKDDVYVLKLKKKIKVEKLGKIKRFDLYVLNSNKLERKIKKKNGKKVRIKGKIMPFNMLHFPKCDYCIKVKSVK